MQWFNQRSNSKTPNANGFTLLYANVCYTALAFQSTFRALFFIARILKYSLIIWCFWVFFLYFLVPESKKKMVYWIFMLCNLILYFYVYAWTVLNYSYIRMYIYVAFNLIPCKKQNFMENNRYLCTSTNLHVKINFGYCAKLNGSKLLIPLCWNILKRGTGVLSLIKKNCNESAENW